VDLKVPSGLEGEQFQSKGELVKFPSDMLGPVEDHNIEEVTLDSPQIGHPYIGQVLKLDILQIETNPSL
jgi:hypothetical protein